MSHSPQSTLLQGALLGAVAQMDDFLAVSFIHVEYDSEGNYTNTFVVELASGKKIRVIVEDEDETEGKLITHEETDLSHRDRGDHRAGGVQL